MGHPAPGVERVGSKIGSVRPHDRAKFGVDSDPSKEHRVPQRPEDGADVASKSLGQIDFGHDTVGENEAQTELAEVLYGPDLVGSAHGRGLKIVRGWPWRARSQSASSS